MDRSLSGNGSTDPNERQWNLASLGLELAGLECGLRSAYAAWAWIAGEFVPRLSRATEIPLSLEYKGCVVDTAFRADIVVADGLVVELKSVEQMLPLHSAQLLTYLRVMHLPIGLLINFNVPRLRSGIRRIINRHALT